jgi:hypothetical protein
MGLARIFFGIRDALVGMGDMDDMANDKKLIIRACN